MVQTEKMLEIPKENEDSIVRANPSIERRDQIHQKDLYFLGFKSVNGYATYFIVKTSVAELKDFQLYSKENGRNKKNLESLARDFYLVGGRLYAADEISSDFSQTIGYHSQNNFGEVKVEEVTKDELTFFLNVYKRINSQEKSK